MSKGKNKSVRRVGFISFHKLSLLYGLAVGQVGGVACLVGGICGAPVYINLGTLRLTGFPAGLGLLVLLPLLLGLGSLLAAPVLYFPFTLTSNLLGGFKASNES